MSSSNPDNTQISLSLQHLQLEMARVDLLIQQDVRRWQLAGQNPDENFRGLYVTGDKARGRAGQNC